VPASSDDASTEQLTSLANPGVVLLTAEMIQDFVSGFAPR